MSRRTFRDLREIANGLELAAEASETLEGDADVNALAMQLDDAINTRIREASADRVDFFLAEKVRIKRRICDEVAARAIAILKHEIATLERV